MSGWAATNTLRGAIDSGFECTVPGCPACKRKNERLAALALVEAALDAAEAVGSGGPGLAMEFPYLSGRLDALAAALRAVREGAS